MQLFRRLKFERQNSYARHADRIMDKEENRQTVCQIDTSARINEDGDVVYCHYSELRVGTSGTFRNSAQKRGISLIRRKKKRNGDKRSREVVVIVYAHTF